jgi:hypothetical protein
MELLRAIFIGPLAQMIAAPDFLAQTIWEGFVAGVLYSLIARIYQGFQRKTQSATELGSGWWSGGDSNL